VNSAVFGWLADYSGCGYYRILQPMNELGRLGYKFKCDIAWPTRLEEEYEVLVGQRTSKLGVSQKWQHFAQQGKNFMIYETDDDLFNIERHNEKAYFYFTHPETIECMEQNIRVADMVTVTNQYLADQVNKLNSNTKILPNFIEEQLTYLPKHDIIIPIDDKGTTENISEKYVTIGYTSSPTHQADFNLVKEHLALLQLKHENVIYIFLGEEPYPVPRYVNLGWFQDIGEYYHNVNFDIGIAPLTKSTFNNSKSYLKALEYAAKGIPVVASDEPPYHDFVKHGETGFLAKQPYQFGRYLRDLVNDQAMREEMGAKAREYAREFTIEKNIGLYIDAYKLEKK